MGRAPGFTTVAILILALGIGANTAIFSVLYAVWLSPAKYPGAKGLVDVSWQQLTGRRFFAGTSFPDLADWRSQAKTIEDFAAHRYAHQVNVSGEQGAEEVIGHRVSANLFDLLGVRPALGLPLDAEADRSAGPRQALISYAWWRGRFGAEARVVGKKIRVNDEVFTITGVMPQGFEFPPMGSAAYRPVIWMSLNVSPEQERSRAYDWLAVIARLKSESSIHQAQAEMSTIAARMAITYPKEHGGWGIKVTSFNDARQVQEARPALLLVMGAASLVLLIACANVANLLLARAFRREQEMAVRRALGATPLRLACQLLTESGVLALSGGFAGVLLAYAEVPLLKAVLPLALPRADEVAVSGPVLWFAAAASLLTGLLFGAIPALRQDSKACRDLGGARTLTAHSRAGRVLVIVEVALAMVLIAGAGLLIESFRRVTNVDLGFSTGNTITARMKLTNSRYPDPVRVAAFRTELLSRVEGMPGVQYAGTVSSLPMGIVMQGTEFEIEGRPETASEKPFVDRANVSRDYLRAMDIRLVHGRYFDSGDRPGAAPVALISESVARTYWPRGAALGSHVRFDNTWFTIAGIVRDVQQYSPEQGARGGTIYALNEQLPLEVQGGDMGRLIILVTRAEGNPPIVDAIRRTVAEIDKDQPVADVSTMEQLVSRTLAGRRLNTLLLGVFAGLATVLAAVGVLAVTSYTVARRTKEIGIRMALGAAPISVLMMMARETLVLAVIGAGAGIGATAATSRLLAGFLFGVRPAEPVIIVPVTLVLVTTVVASGMIPAWRAMHIDPMVALREE
jgi:putative ABC transport system permease protein